MFKSIVAGSKGDDQAFVEAAGRPTSTGSSRGPSMMATLCPVLRGTPPPAWVAPINDLNNMKPRTRLDGAMMRVAKWSLWGALGSQGAP